MTRGKYIVIEGHDGTGKSTQVALLRDILLKQGIQSVEMHEPGGIPMSDALRAIIKGGALERDGTTNLLLFTAARRELWRQLAEPALAEGRWVIAARNWYSTLAYQGYGEGLDAAVIEQVTRNFMPIQYVTPDFACILTLDDITERRRRITRREGEREAKDTFESRNNTFQTRVAQGYETIAKQFSLPTIDAAQSPEKIAQQIHAHITK